MRAWLSAIVTVILIAGTPGGGLTEPVSERPIAVRSNEALASFLADGTKVGNVGDILWAPSWSPDGTRLAVFMNDGGIMSSPGILDASSGHALFADPPNATYLYKPIWAPDGRSIALIQYSDIGFSIVVVDVATSEIIAEGKIPDRFTANYPYPMAGVNAFSWSPDGTKIMFSWQGVLVFDVANEDVHIASDQFALAFWPPDSAGVCLLQYKREGPSPIELGHLARYDLNSRKLSRIAAPDEISDAGITAASWLITGSIQLSPDGKSVALSMGNSPTQTDAIRIYDASPGCISDLLQPRLVFETALVPAMDWAPTSDAIVFFEHQEDEGPSFVFLAQVIELETGNRVQLLQLDLEGLEVDVFGLLGTLAWSS